MEYLLLIYTDEKAWAERSDGGRRAVTREYDELADELRDHGRYITSAPLLPTTAASTVRVRDDEQLVTDGPFADTREQLVGYFLIEAESDEEARSWAAKIPAARHGSVEVRPVLQVPATTPRR
jgi:hypothetical protein